MRSMDPSHKAQDDRGHGMQRSYTNLFSFVPFPTVHYSLRCRPRTTASPKGQVLHLPLFI